MYPKGISLSHMLAPESITHILYHANCPDGFGAAWAAWKVLGSKASYIPVSHGDPPPSLPPHSNVAIIDFAYPREISLTLKDKVQGLIVLDHHVTAEKELEGLDFAIFDKSISGATLGWQYFHPKEEVPLFIKYLQDKDLWTWELPSSQEFSAALASYPFDFTVWESLTVDQLLQEGKTLLRLQKQLVDLALTKHFWANIAGYSVPVVNAMHFRSEIANLLCHKYPSAPFAAVYQDLPQGVRGWSLRSVGDFDVASIAKSLGGGGHKNAAGFTQPSPLDSTAPLIQKS